MSITLKSFRDLDLGMLLHTLTRKKIMNTYLLVFSTLRKKTPDTGFPAVLSI